MRLGATTLLLLTVSFIAAVTGKYRDYCSGVRIHAPFGVAKNVALDLRGGEVIEAKTLQEVESIILSASASNKLVVIDFSATWCGPCKMIAPLYHQLSEMAENGGAVFLKVDVDENPDTAAKYSVSAMPTFLFIKGGEVVERIMGANAQKLQEMLAELQ